MKQTQTGKEKRSVGRPAAEFNPEHAKHVQTMSQYGVPQEDIAASIGIHVGTMMKLYRDEFRRGKSIANSKIGQTLFEKAIAGDTVAAIFWAKTQMGWKETQKIEQVGSVATVQTYKVPENGRD